MFWATLMFISSLLVQPIMVDIAFLVYCRICSALLYFLYS